MRFAAVILLILCAGCYTQKQAAKQVARAAIIYPAQVSSLCVDFFPPKVVDSISYIYGSDTLFATDTIAVECDSAGVKVIYLDRPVMRVDTFIRTVTNTVTKLEKQKQDNLWALVAFGAIAFVAILVFRAVRQR